MTVILEDYTVGYTATPCSVGDIATISLRDENGMPTTKTGRVSEILEVEDDY